MQLCYCFLCLFVIFKVSLVPARVSLEALVFFEFSKQTGIKENKRKGERIGENVEELDKTNVSK